MIVNRNFFGEVDTPDLFLCNPGCTYDTSTSTLSNVVGSIPNPSDMECELNFNSTSKMSFRIYKTDDSLGEIENEFIEKMFKEVKTRRQVFVDGFGFFSISSIDIGYEDGKDYKDVEMTSCECELENKTIPYIEDGTYSFQEMMDVIIGNTPLWTYDIGSVPYNIETMFRTFEDVDVESNTLTFLLENMQDAFECIFIFDCINRVISVYDQNDYVKIEPIHLTKDSFITKIDISEDTDDMYTALHVTGDDDVSINSVNPSGSSTIYNFEYYLDWMSEGLKEKVEEWKGTIDAYSETYYHLNLEYYNAMTEKDRCKYDLDMIDTRISMYKKLKENMVATMDKSIISEYNAEILATNFSWIKTDEIYSSSTQYYSGDRVNYGGVVYLCYRLKEPGEWDKDTWTKYWIRVAEDSGSANAIDIEADYSDAKEEIEDFVAKVDALIADCEKTSAKIDIEMNSISPSDREYVEEDGERKYKDGINKVSVSVEDIEKEIKTIQDACNINSLFDQNDPLFEELQSYIFEGSYSDEYVKITDIMTMSEKFDQIKKMYDRAIKQMNKVASPKQEFKVDVQDFIFTPETSYMADRINVGVIANVEIEDDCMAELFINNITINYEDKSVSITFGNRFDRADQKSLFEDVLGNIQKSSNTISYMKDILYPVKKGKLNSMQQAINDSRTIAKNSAITSSNQKVVIDDSGYTGKTINSDGTEGDNQIKITGSNIVFTEDGWNTSGVAIGKLVIKDENGNNVEVYGVNAEHIIGDIVIGRNLKIYSETIDENNNIVNESLMQVLDNKITSGVSSGISGMSTTVNQTAEKLDVIINSSFFESKITKDDGTEETTYTVNPQSSITTTNGYSFGSDGLIISKTGNADDVDIENRIDNTGMYVRRVSKEVVEYGDEDENEDYTTRVETVTKDVLTANKDGVNAENITVRNYLNIGDNSRIENYDVKKTVIDDITGESLSATEHRTACFYIGEGTTFE